MDILTAKQVSEIMGKNLRWVYQFAIDLGGWQIPGSSTWFFSKEGLENAIQNNRNKTVQSRSKGKRHPIYVEAAEPERSQKMGRGRAEKITERVEDLNRHGLITCH
jgi:hypothetical protein